MYIVQIICYIDLDSGWKAEITMFNFETYIKYLEA